MLGFRVQVSVGHHLYCFFYSRRIGLAKGRAIPILAGGKMTGKNRTLRYRNFERANEQVYG